MPTINKKANNIQQPKYVHESKAASLKYYNSIGWRKLRQSIMSTYPLCVECASKGISRQATDLHHRIPFLTGKTDDERWQLLLDPDNVVPLCEPCHYNIHSTHTDTHSTFK